MTFTDSTRRRGRTAHNRWTMFAAAATVAALAAAAVVTAGGGAAGAASLPQSQSVGNFLDATLNDKPIDQLAKLQYATAQSPGEQSAQNPLDASALNDAIKLPLTGDLQLPPLLGATVGAVNQVAVANSDGSSYGAAGAVANSGGASIGGNNNAYPADATIDLCGSALSGGRCGTKATDALGELKLQIGAVSALASTQKGYGKAGSTQYQIAGLNLVLGSPQLGSVLGNVSKTVGGILNTLTGVLKTVPGQPSDCQLSPNSVPTTIPLAGGAVTLNASDATITVDVEALLETAHLDLNSLPANTDLVKWLVTHLSDILGAGLTDTINGVIDPLKTQISNCLSSIQGLSTITPTLLQSVEQAVGTALAKLSGVVKTVTDAIAPLTDALTKVIDIGVNVQPNGPAGTFKSALAATPKQGTPVVKGQTIVRAIEIDLVGDPLAVVALANAAAGPSTAPAPVPAAASAAPSGAPAAPDQIPTGVPAGSGTHGGGLPLLPLGLLLLALMFAGGGGVAFMLRGRLNQR